MRKLTLAIATLAVLGLGSAASGHDAASHGGGHQHGATIDGGQPDVAANVSRTATIVAKDTEFSPKSISVKAGETVRFIVRNDGRFVHELTIGTPAMQAEHQSEMLGFAVSGALGVDTIDRAKLGSHDHGNNVLLEPGKSGEVIWKFAKAADLEFGCNVPGHYEQGMKGQFLVD